MEDTQFSNIDFVNDSKINILENVPINQGRRSHLKSEGAQGRGEVLFFVQLFIAYLGDLGSI